MSSLSNGMIETGMNIEDLTAVYELWREAYPYLASQAVKGYGRTSGRVLELGPFCGGVSLNLAKLYPEMFFTLADGHAAYLEYVGRKIGQANLDSRIKVVNAPLEKLPFASGCFDLIILRGAFFFIMDKPHILAEIYRVLASGGLALVGGGYGDGISQEIIDGIAPQSRLLNRRLGQRHVSLEELRTLVDSLGLTQATRICEEGGVWLLLRKRVAVSTEMPDRLGHALGLGKNEVISLTGGGGKTSLMFALANELADSGSKVISTTTTHIMRPTREQSSCVVTEGDDETLAFRLREELETHNHVTAAAVSPEEKLNGLTPETIDKIAAMRLAHYIINEADGASCKPIKAPRKWEPVIPRCTTLVAAVAGMDALNAPLSPDIAFQPGLVTSLTGVPPGSAITDEAIATLMTHERGIIQYAPQTARVVPFLNKTELAERDAVCDLAAAVLSRRHPQIDRVVAASLRSGSAGLRVFTAL